MAVTATRSNQPSRTPSARTLQGLDWLNFFLADVQTGVGPFLAIYLAGYGWNEERVGLALMVASVAGIAAQTPAGALVDSLRAKRALIAGAVGALALGALVIASFPSLWPVIGGQVLIGATSSVFIPAVCAISLGVVGSRAFDARQGRNQTFNAAGNVTSAILIGLVGYYLSNRSIFFLVMCLAVPTILTLTWIRPEEIDHDAARGAAGDDRAQASGFGAFLKNRPLVVFLVCAILFHFANAAMLPLLGQMLAKGRGRSSMLFMAACVVMTQLVVTFVSSWSGRMACSWGRKPLLLLGFGVLPIRGVLYTLTGNTVALVAIQVLDGIGAGIFNVVSVLVIADLTRGTGRFNITLGAITTAVGIGASISQFVAGSIVHRGGYNTGFFFLAGVAALAFALLYFVMPETKEGALNERG